MRRSIQVIVTLSVLMLTLCGTLRAEPLFDGREVVAEDGSFRILFPRGFGEPKTETRPVETSSGPVESTSYMASNPHGVCGVAYSDMPDQSMTPSDIKRMFDSSQSLALKNTNGKVNSQKAIKLDGVPGRSITYTASKEGMKLYCRVDLYFDAPRFYQIIYVSDQKNTFTSADVKAYFASFKISNPGQNRSLSEAEMAVETSTPFTSSDGRFKVILPTGFPDPTESTQPIETALGSLDMKSFVATYEEAACMVAYIDYPSDAIHEADIPKMLDGGQEGALKNMHGKLVSRKDVTLSGNPGRSITFTTMIDGRNAYGRFDFYVVGARLYELFYLSHDKGNLGKSDVRRFFSSFGLTER